MSRAWREKNPSYRRDYYLAHREREPTPILVIDGAKRCTRCKVTKPLEDFNLHRKGTAGRRAVCKDCRQLEHRANPEPARERARRARETNPEYMRLWRQNNRDLLAENFLRYKLRLTGQTYGHSVDFMAALAAELRTQPCEYCAGPGGEVDHVVPLARGGPHHPQNLSACCRSCNSSKGARRLEEWPGPLKLAA